MTLKNIPVFCAIPTAKFDAGQKGKFKEVDIDTIMSDSACHNPDLDQETIRLSSKITDNPQYVLLGAIILALLPNGQHMIVDGLKRCIGLKNAGAKKIPALVFNLDYKSRLKAWKEANSERKIPDAIKLYRASLNSGEAWAIVIDDLIARTGCRMMTFNASTSHKKPGQVFAIGMVRTFIESGKSHYMTSVLEGLLNSRHKDVVRYYSENSLRAFIAAAINAKLDKPEQLTAYFNATDIGAIEDRVRFARGDNPDRDLKASYSRFFSQFVSDNMEEYVADVKKGKDEGPKKRPAKKKPSPKKPVPRKPAPKKPAPKKPAKRQPETK
jgi:hypothetical protein